MCTCSRDDVDRRDKEREIEKRHVALPGWDKACLAPNNSDFLSVEGGTNLPYWFVEAECAPKVHLLFFDLDRGRG